MPPPNKKKKIIMSKSTLSQRGEKTMKNIHTNKKDKIIPSKANKPKSSIHK